MELPHCLMGLAFLEPTFRAIGVRGNLYLSSCRFGQLEQLKFTCWRYVCNEPGLGSVHHCFVPSSVELSILLVGSRVISNA